MCCKGGCIGGNARIAIQKTAKKSLLLLLDKNEDIKL